MRGQDYMLHQSLDIHYAKKQCITDMICNEEYGEWEDDVCRFTLYRFTQECPYYHKSLADPKIAKRHLDAEVELGLLDIDSSRGKVEYVYRRGQKLPL